MRLWQKEHGLEYDIPSIIDHLVDKKVLEDTSWHNDSAPSFAIADPNEEDYGIRLWIDHPFFGNREHEGKRFGIQLGEMAGEPDDDAETDDLEEALTRIFKHAKESRFSEAEIRNQPWWSEDMSPAELMAELRDYWRREQEKVRKSGRGWRPR